MLILVYAVICTGALGISFISMLDQKAVNNLAVRIVTVVVLGVSWYEPLTMVTRVFENQSGPPQWLMIAIPLVVMIPFFYTTVTIFTGPLGVVEKIQSTVKFTLKQEIDSFPEAEKAEAAMDWDKAFAVYRDKYLPRQYTNELIWKRLLSIFRRWNDLDKTLNELMAMVKGAPDEESRVAYALQSADVLTLGLATSGRAVRLLKAVIPAFTNENFRLMVNGKLAAIGAMTERGGATVTTPRPQARP